MPRPRASALAEEAFYGELLAQLHAERYRDHALTAAARLRELLGGRQPSSVVDLGCGSGDLLAAFAAPGTQLLGIDRSGDLLAYAARRACDAELVEASIYDVALPSSVDLLCAVGEVLQYGPDPRAGREAVRWLCELAAARLGPGGLLAFDLVTPGRAGPLGHRVLERDHDGWRVEVESWEVGRELRRQITTRRGDFAEVEVHEQVTVTPGEALAAVTSAGLEVRFLADAYDGTAITERSTSVAIVAGRP